MAAHVFIKLETEKSWNFYNSSKQVSWKKKTRIRLLQFREAEKRKLLGISEAKLCQSAFPDFYKIRNWQISCFIKIVSTKQAFTKIASMKTLMDLDNCAHHHPSLIKEFTIKIYHMYTCASPGFHKTKSWKEEKF